MAMTLTTSNFEQEVLQSKEPVLVDFWAAWCGPCRMMTPIIDQLSAEANGYKVGKVNVDEETDIARRYGIMSIPTLIVFKDGQVHKQAVGAMSKERLLDLLK